MQGIDPAILSIISSTIIMITKKLLAIALIFIANYAYSSQKDSVTVGKRIPDFTIQEVYNYTATTAQMSDFKGKWLILDFWTAGCTSCIESFPKMDALQTRYKENLKLIFIGKDDKYIRPMFDKFKARENLQFTYSYDNLLFKKFDVYLVPFIIVVDPNGTVRSVTTKITEADIKDLMNNKAIVTRKAETATEIDRKYAKYDSEKPLLINNNGGNDTSFSFRSLLTKWTLEGIPQSSYRYLYRKGNMVQTTGSPIAWLYEMAYGDTVSNYPVTSEIMRKRRSSFGQLWTQAIIESKDSVKIISTDRLFSYRFSYSLIVPKEMAYASAMQKIMRNDLDNYFGYSVTVENRKMPCWKLLLKNRNLFEKRDKIKKNINKNFGFSDSIALLPGKIWGFHQDEVIVDDTGLNADTIINIEAFMSSIPEIQKALQNIGLELRESKKEMKVIIIKDPIDKL
jgi:thiol-disulfide isomerase/thioredoxin